MQAYSPASISNTSVFVPVTFKVGKRVKVGNRFRRTCLIKGIRVATDNFQEPKNSHVAVFSAALQKRCNQYQK